MTRVKIRKCEQLKKSTDLLYGHIKSQRGALKKSLQWHMMTLTLQCEKIACLFKEMWHSNWKKPCLFILILMYAIEIDWKQLDCGERRMRTNGVC